MKIKSLALNNIRSYDDQIVEFPDGTILIHGENGAGKTSLLMGIFGGLFLSKIRNVGNSNFNLDDLVRRGEDKGAVILIFEIDGTEFTVTWELYSTGTPSSATLDSPAFSEPVTGIRSVREEIIGLLGMDEDDFSSSVYVKQGEIDRLIEAGNRAEMIDSLLGLDELDEYIQRMKLGRRGANRVQTRNSTSRENYQDDLESFEHGEHEYNEKIQSLTDDISEFKSKIGELEDFIDKLKDHRRGIRSDIEDFEALQERKSEKEEQIEDAQAKRTEQHSVINESETAIEDARAEITTLEDAIAECDGAVEHDLETEQSAREEIEIAHEAYIAATTERQDCKNRLGNTKDELERLQQDLSEVRNERDELTEERDSLEDDLTTATEKLAELEAELGLLTTERNESVVGFLSKVNKPGKVTDGHKDDIEDQLDEFRTEREDLIATTREITTKRSHVEERLGEKENELATATNDLADTKSELDRIEAEIADVADDLEDAEGTFEHRIETLTEKGSDLGVDVTSDILEELRDSTIPDFIERTNEELNKISSTIAEHRNDEQRCEEELLEIEKLGEQGKCPKCGQPVDETHIEEEIEELQEAINATQSALEEAQETQTNFRSRKSALQSLREDVLNAVRFREETLTTMREQLESLRDEKTDCLSEIEELEATIDEGETTIADLEDKVADLEDRESSLDDDIEVVTESIETAESILDSFGEVANQKDAVAALEDEIGDIKFKIDDLDAKITEIVAELEELQESIEEQQAEVEDCEGALEAAEETVEEANSALETVDEAVEKYGSINELRATIEQEQRTIQHCRDRIDDLNAQIARLEAEKDDIEDQLGEKDVDDLREDLERVNDRIEQRQETRDDYQKELQENRDTRTRLETELDSFRATKAQIELHERKEQWAKEIHDELDSIISIYERTKSDLREQYLAYINEYTNDIFKEIYKNSSYQQVLIEEVYDDRSGSYEYDIKLLRDNGTSEDPSNASGGERAIVNLALRAGIYKLIAELHGGNRGQLPPFILDEPTTYLDEGHVGQLEQMLTTIKQWDVPQIIVVSHDESLIHGADHECHVTIDEANNTSQISMRTAGAD